METGISFETFALPVGRFLITFLTEFSVKSSKENFFSEISFLSFCGVLEK